MKNIFILVLLLTVLVNQAIADNWTIYTAENSDIPSNYITDIVSDDSLLWIGTIKGLASFNDSVWTIYDEDNSPLPNSYISSLFFDDSLLWIGQSSNLISFNGVEWKNYNTHYLGIQNSIEGIAQFDSKMWLMASGVIYVFDGVGLSRIDYTNSSLPNQYFNTVEANDTIIWFGSLQNQYASFNGNEWTTGYVNNIDNLMPGGQYDIFSFLIEENKLWVCSSFGLYTYRNDSWEQINKFDTPPGYGPVFDILKNGKWYWFGIYDDLVLFDGEKWNLLSHNDFSEYAQISNITKYKDKIWVTAGHSLASYKLIVSVNTNNIPTDYKLIQNYPNPFNPITTIGFDIYEDSDVKLDIFDVTGQLVKTLVNEFRQAGHYKIKWDASKYSSGIYIYRLEYLDKHISRKMLLIK